MNPRARLFSAAVAIGAVAGCGPSIPLEHPAPKPPASVVVAGPAVRKVSLEDVGLSSTILDRAISPCDDFYQFSCGAWLKATQIPPDELVWTRSFSEMAKTVRNNLRTMLEKYAAPETAAAGGDKAMLGDFYASCMDEKAIDGAGTTAIADLLARIDRSADLEAVAKTMYFMNESNVRALLGLNAVVDKTDSAKVSGGVFKAGYELGYDDYVAGDKKHTELLAHYTAYLEALLEASPTPKSARKRRLRNTLSIEAQLSKWVASEHPGAKDISTRWIERDFIRELPGFPWAAYFSELRPGNDAGFTVWNPDAVEQAVAIFKSQSLEAIKDYLYTRTLVELTYVLDARLRDARFGFRAFRWAIKKPKERWADCVRITEHTLGDFVPSAYAAEYGFDRADPRVEAMIKDLYDAWEERLNEVPWLDAATRKRAIEKLRAISVHIGYPDRKDIPLVAIDRGAFAKNVLRADRARIRRDLATIGGPQDPDAWSRSPLEANAYHDHERNSIFIHLAMIQPPIYDPRASLPVQYGTLGMTIGHELGHGFDHKGSKYDLHGEQRNWWSDGVKREFDERQSCFVDQFSALPIFPDLNVNGKLSVGENIADVAGLRVAFMAYRKRRAGAKEVLVAGGFDEDQQFFLSRAQAWCTLMTEEAERGSAATNPHIDPRWAVDGPLHDLPEFYRAFGCEPPKDVCTMW